jgi:hypothetical protein
LLRFVLLATVKVFKFVLLATVTPPAKNTSPLKRLSPLNVELESVTPEREVITAGTCVVVLETGKNVSPEELDPSLPSRPSLPLAPSLPAGPGTLTYLVMYVTVDVEI